MHFIKGFLKVAEFDHNNMGQPFNLADSPNFGITGAPLDLKKQPAPAKNKKTTDAVNLIMAKLSADPYASDGVGTAGEGASTLVSQLKWDPFSTADNTQDPGYNKRKTSLFSIQRKKPKK
jgi:hypothetical protein